MKTLLLLMFVLLVACSGGGNESSTTVINSKGSSGKGEVIGPGSYVVDESLSFSGISSLTEKTDSTVKLNWSYNSSATSYVIFQVKNGSYIELIEMTDPTSSSHVLTGLTPGETYSFHVRMKVERDSKSLIDDNKNILSVTLDENPAPASGIEIVSAPVGGVYIRPNPTIKVSGVKKDDQVILFKDPQCSLENKLVEGQSEGSSLEVVTTPLDLGVTEIYAQVKNSIGGTSPCSTAHVSYERASCPEGYVPVNAESDFCVAQYEMKCDGEDCQNGHNKEYTLVGNVNAISQSTGLPWVYISSSDAKTACANIGPQYALISNAQWMTIAHDLELNKLNWIGGEVGQLAMYRGHTDNDPAAILPVLENDPYDGTQNSSSSSPEQRRLFTLSNGSEIWDISGNASEWVDGKITTCSDNFFWEAKEMEDINCILNKEFSFLPLNPLNLNPYNSTLNLGKILPDVGSAQRGGGFDDYDTAGIFSLIFSLTSDDRRDFSKSVGFRCIYDPSLVDEGEASVL